MTKMDQLRSMKLDFETKLRDLGKAAVNEQLNALFETHPTLQGVRWTQYTPYFNDGDPCEFGLHEIHYTIKKEEERTGSADEQRTAAEDGDEDADWLYPSAYGEGDDDALDIAMREFERDRLSDAYEAAFGDHVEVIATRSGIEVNEYSHD